MKKIAVINDLSGYGRCSLAVMLPVISALGCQACPAPTALFSNHTGYAKTCKLDLTENLRSYFAMWEENGFVFDAILSGYLGSARQAEVVLDFISGSQRRVPETAVIVDPAMADHGRLYRGITEAHAAGMRSLCAAADLITPNLTEACILTSADYAALEAEFAQYEVSAARLTPLAEALHRLLRRGGTAVVSGIGQGERLYMLVSPPDAPPTLLESRRTGGDWHGTGDLFAAILAADWLRHGDPVRATGRAADFIAKAIRHSEELHVPEPEGVQFEDLLNVLTDD